MNREQRKQITSTMVQQVRDQVEKCKREGISYTVGDICDNVGIPRPTYYNHLQQEKRTEEENKLIPEGAVKLTGDNSLASSILEEQEHNKAVYQKEKTESVFDYPGGDSIISIREYQEEKEVNSPLEGNSLDDNVQDTLDSLQDYFIENLACQAPIRADSSISSVLPNPVSPNSVVINHPLKDFIPSKVEGYLKLDWQINAARILDAKMPILLLGESGTGKTEFVKQYCYYRSLPLLVLSCETEFRVKDILGRFITQEGEVVYLEGILERFMKSDYPCMILFDEVNRIDPSQLTPFHEVLNGDIGKKHFYNPMTNENIEINSHVGFAFAGNVNSEDYTVETVCKAFADRLLTYPVPSIPFQAKEEILTSNQVNIPSEILKFFESQGLFQFRQIYKLIELSKLGLDLRQSTELVFGSYYRAIGDEERLKEVLTAVTTFWPEV